MDEPMRSERVLADTDPSRTDDRYRTIVERLPLVVYTHDGGRPPAMTYVSPQVEGILGIPAARWLEHPRSWITRIHPEDRASVLAALDTATIEGRDVALEYRVRPPDGRIVWVRDEAAPIRDDDGHIVYWQGTLVDVTDRRAAEEALRGTERRSELMIDSVTDHAMLMLEADGTIVSWNRGAERLFGYTEPEVVGTSIGVLLPEERRAELRAELHRAASEGRAESEGWRVRRDGSRFWGHSVTMPVRDGAGRVIGLARVTRDLTERRDAARQLSQRVRQQAAVAELGMRAVNVSDPEPMLDEATHVTARTLDMPFAALFLVQDEHLPLGTAPMLLAYGAGWSPGIIRSYEILPEPGSVLWQSLVAGEPVIVPDPSPVVTRSLPLLFTDHGIISAVSVAVRVGNRPIGVLVVGTDREMAPGESELYFVQAVTNVIGSFLQRSRTEHEIRAIDADRSRLLARVLTSQEEERAHVARELHDDLAQTLAGIGLFAASMTASAEGDARATSEEISTLAQDAAQAVRRLIGDLRPMELEEGFAHAAERLASAAGARRGTAVEFRLDGEVVRLPDDMEVAVYRIAQEALQNVVKHAPSAPGTLTVRYTEAGLEVDVADEGPGFTTEPVTGSEGEHVGILGMQERATLIGADLDVRSTPGHGTLVQLRVPIRRIPEASG